MKNEENQNKKFVLNENILLKCNTNYNFGLIDNRQNIISPNQFSSNSKISFGKEIPTGDTNGYSNLKILKNVNIILNTKKLKPLKEEKTKNNFNNFLEKLPIKQYNNFFINNSKKKIIGQTDENNKLNDTKIKLKNSLNYNKEVYVKIDNSLPETNREIKKVKINFKKKESEKNINTLDFECLFCGKIYQDKTYYENFRCDHYFCKECGKNYYENLLGKSESKYFKCPVFSCPSSYSYQFIKSLTSLKSKKFEHQYNINYKERNNVMKELNSKENFISYEKIMKKNVIEINDKNNFYTYVKRILFECPACKEISLYGTIKTPYYKCLKCLKNFCKYCREEYNNSHFDLSCKEHCKVFYRIKEKKIKNKKLIDIVLFFKLFFLFICAFLFIMTFFINKLKYSLKIRNICKKITYIIIFIILSLVFTPLSILLIPYFPIICSI